MVPESLVLYELNNFTIVNIIIIIEYPTRQLTVVYR